MILRFLPPTALCLSFVFWFLPAQASVLDYHRQVLENPTATSASYTQRAQTSTRRPAKSSSGDDIRSRIAARLLQLRSQKLSDTKLASNQTITASQVDFRITVPDDFSQESDTLKASEGALNITRSNGDMIVVQATPKTCLGGNTAFFDCFQKHWKARQAQFLARYPNAKVLENKDVLWRNDSVSTQQVTPGNTGRYYTLEQGNDRMVLFLFRHPVLDNIWEIEITGSKTGSILSERNGATRILNTMFTSNNSLNANKDRLKVNTVLNYQNRISTGTPRTQKSFYAKKDVVAINAEGLSFSVEVPKTYTKTSDDLMRTMGSLEINDQASAAQVKIIASADICNSQTSLVLRNCLRAFNETAQKEFALEKNNLSLVLQRNYALQLTAENSSKSDFAYYTLYRSTDSAQRYALLTWREPSEGAVWYMQVAAPENDNAILSNQQKLNAMITSMRYR